MANSSSDSVLTYSIYWQASLFPGENDSNESFELKPPGACIPTQSVNAGASKGKAGTSSKQKKRMQVKVMPGQLALDLEGTLRRPVLNKGSVPDLYRSMARSDKERPNLPKDDGSEAIELPEEELARGISVPYEAWGNEWFETHDGLKWSKEGIYYLQVQLFWDSLIELTLSNNIGEKWDVLKWIFKPAIRKYFHFGRPTVQWHETDEPFSFATCCKALRMNPDDLRDWLRKQLLEVDPEIMKAIDTVFQRY